MLLSIDISEREVAIILAQRDGSAELAGQSHAALGLDAVCIDRDGTLGESGRRRALHRYCGEDAFPSHVVLLGESFHSQNLQILAGQLGTDAAALGDVALASNNNI